MSRRIWCRHHSQYVEWCPMCAATQQQVAQEGSAEADTQGRPNHPQEAVSDRRKRGEAAGPSDAEKAYPCHRCGTLRTKAEGGTVFTVCDACWDDTRAQRAGPSDACCIVCAEVVTTNRVHVCERCCQQVAFPRPPAAPDAEREHRWPTQEEFLEAHADADAEREELAAALGYIRVLLEAVRDGEPATFDDKAIAVIDRAAAILRGQE